MSHSLKKNDGYADTMSRHDTETKFSLNRVSAPPAPHFLEREVQRRLLSEPHYQFPSLAIHRMKNGVCLEGVLITDENAPDVTELLREIRGVDDVVNHLVVCHAGAAETVN